MKKLVAFVLAALLCAGALAKQVYQDVVTDRSGNARSGVSVTILTSAGAVATIYESDGTTTKANPIVTSTLGAYSFAAANGHYTVRVIDGGTTYTQTVSLYDPADDRKSVIEYGAKCNGTTDDTDAIQSALTAAGTIYVPPGTCMVRGSGLTLSSGTRLVGAGRFISTIKAIGTPTSNLMVASSKSNITIEDIGIDAGEYTVGANYGSVNFTLSTNVRIRNAYFSGFDRFAIVVNGGTYVEITGNQIVKTTAASTQNQGILVSCSAGAAGYFNISDNTLVNTAMDVCAYRSQISRNRIRDWKFGGGITIEQSANAYELVIDSNVTTGGTGIDSNGFHLQGIENWSPRAVVSNNIASNNSGSGITHGGKDGVVVGNITYDNGTVGGKGIDIAYSSATYTADGSVFSANRAFNTLGAAGTQSYGMYIETGVARVTIAGDNNLIGNALGPIFVQGSYIAESRPKLTGSATYDPPSIAAGGTTTTTVTATGAASGDICIATFSADLQGVQMSAYASSADTVTVRSTNPTTGAIDNASGTLTVVCEKKRNYADY